MTPDEGAVIEAAVRLAMAAEHCRWQAPQILPALDAFFSAYRLYLSRAKRAELEAAGKLTKET